MKKNYSEPATRCREMSLEEGFLASALVDMDEIMIYDEEAQG